MVESQLFRGTPEKRRPDIWDFFVLGRPCDASKGGSAVGGVTDYDISMASEWIIRNGMMKKAGPLYKQKKSVLLAILEVTTFQDYR
jgi:hypothetical protein